MFYTQYVYVYTILYLLWYIYHFALFYSHGEIDYYIIAELKEVRTKSHKKMKKKEKTKSILWRLPFAVDDQMNRYDEIYLSSTLDTMLDDAILWDSGKK